jgi:hypothetical protein
MTELCSRYSIGRVTGYGWADRYRQSGVGGLDDRGRPAERKWKAFIDLISSPRLPALRNCAHPYLRLAPSNPARVFLERLPR